MKILIVDDELDIREILAFNLEAAGYTVEQAASAEEALEKMMADVDLVLLDVMLPGMSGFHLTDYLRKECHNNVPIIFLTANSSENNLLTAFSAGGDDYISKPFSIHEVLARVRAVLKRAQQPTSSSDKLVCGPLTIDLQKQEVRLEGEPLDLSRKEYDLLCELAKNPDVYLSRAELIQRLWKDTPYIVERTVDVHIARIRNKLGSYHHLIQNKTGFGYAILTKSKR